MKYIFYWTRGIVGSLMVSETEYKKNIEETESIWGVERREGWYL